MGKESLEEIIAGVTRPSRYLGCEINAVSKNPSNARLHIALAFPDLYDIGSSHFGMQILYHILNREPDISAERVFAPAEDMVQILANKRGELFSLETGTFISKFDIVGFSLLYELNYTNILLMLDLAGVPFFSSSRDESHPLIIAGGPCTVNPEPVADFFDAMVIGDGESVILDMARVIIEEKKGGGADRDKILKAWSKIEGVYVPSFFKPVYDEQNLQILTPLMPGYNKVTRAVINDLDDACFPDTPIVAFGKPVHDRLRLEIARGCTRGCRFCQAGMIYRPVRERSFENITDLARRCIDSTGYEDLSLLSLSTGDYSCLSPLMTYLMDDFADRKIALSIPSFRAGSLSGKLMEQIKKTRKTGFTIAPEAGSERLRRVINKNLCEDEISETAFKACNLGWNLLKLYFMIGLPTETDEDLNAIPELVKKLRKTKSRGSRRFNINASIATFIPKSHTPLQWSKQIDVDTAKEKIEMLRRKLKMSGIGFKWQNPETSFLEGIFARGDRRLAGLLVAAYQNGCRFDGWSDFFNYKQWQNALDHAGTVFGTYFSQRLEPNAPLPWDHIDIRISPDFLKDEYARSFNESFTPDCRNGNCQGCGVCDFSNLTPKIAGSQNITTKHGKHHRVFKNQKTFQHQIKIAFKRTGLSRFFSHLEQVSIFCRAIQRAGIPVVFSSGFHPKPKLIFEDALPVGVESLHENCYLIVDQPIRAELVMKKLNKELFEGFEITRCVCMPDTRMPKPPDLLEYRVYTGQQKFDCDCLNRFRAAASFEYRRKTKKGKVKSADLKEHVTGIELETPSCLWLRLDNRAGTCTRPALILKEVFGFDDDQITTARIIKQPASAGS